MQRSFLDFDGFFRLKFLLVQLKLHLVFRGDVFLVQPFEYQPTISLLNDAAVTVFFSNMATVIGPTPPGTGVTHDAF